MLILPDSVSPDVLIPPGNANIPLTDSAAVEIPVVNSANPPIVAPAVAVRSPPVTLSPPAAVAKPLKYPVVPVIPLLAVIAPPDTLRPFAAVTAPLK